MIGSVKITIKRSTRKTTSIYIERDGSLSVFVPNKTTKKEVDALLEANEYKIYKYQAKRALLNERAIKREAVNGQSYLYLGRNYYLQYSSDVDKVECKGRYFYVPDGMPKKLTILLKEFYKRHGKRYIPQRVKKYAPMLGQQINDISVRELRNRWASCSVNKSKVNFHWKIMMAPVSIIDYLIVHELTHLKFPRHNSNFWNAVDKILPNYQKQIAWLKEYGASLEI
jgi:hypothetical protein